jgi:cell division protein FtsA
MGEEIIHVIPQSFIVDNESGVKNPVGMSGKRLEANFHIVIAQVASAKNIEKCVNRAGLLVKSLMLEPLCSAEAVLTFDEKEAGVALVDIGGGTTDIAVYYDHIIRHTAVYPFGGNVITNDIKEGCSILQRQAEALKVQFGSALGEMAEADKVISIAGISGRTPKEISFKSLAFIIQSRMEEILDEVDYQLEESGFKDKLGAGIVLTGGGALLRHLPQLVRFHSSMDVRIGYPNEHLIAATEMEINNPMYSTAIGLLLKGYDWLDENNELKDEELEKPLEVILDTKIEEAVINEAPIIAEEKEEPAGQKSGYGFLNQLKRSLSDMFEENDAKLN